MKPALNIILVDDDQDDQVIFTSAIKEINNNIECTCFDNAEYGLAALQKNTTPKPDCIFLDLNLPVMTGFDLLEILKASNGLSEIPVVIYSTSSRDSDKVKAKELGAFNFLSKPTTFDDLKNKISGLLFESNYFQVRN